MDNQDQSFLSLKDGTQIKISPLDKQLAQKYSEKIVDIWNLIPLSHHTTEDLLTEDKHGRHMYAKWKHSLMALSDSGEIMGFLIAYERQAESDNLYPTNTIYLNSLSVDNLSQGKGLGSFLVKHLVDRLKNLDSFYELEGKIKTLTVQTNASDWNQKVIQFYEKLGFTTVGFKDYPNKKDIVMRYSL